MKRNTLNIIILTLVVINLVLNVLIVFSVVPTANKTNELIIKIAELVDLDLSDFSNKSVATVAVTDLETVAITAGTGDSASNKITVNLKSTDGKPHYAVVYAYITLDQTHEDYASKSGSITNAMPLIAETVTNVISVYDADSAKDPQIQNEMKEEILTELRDLFKSNMIYSVVFESIVIQ